MIVDKWVTILLLDNSWLLKQWKAAVVETGFILSQRYALSFKLYFIKYLSGTFYFYISKILFVSIRNLQKELTGKQVV